MGVTICLDYTVREYRPLVVLLLQERAMDPPLRLLFKTNPAADPLGKSDDNKIIEAFGK